MTDSMITEELKLGEIGPSWGLLNTLQEVLIIGTGVTQKGKIIGNEK